MPSICDGESPCNNCYMTSPYPETEGKLCPACFGSFEAVEAHVTIIKCRSCKRCFHAECMAAHLGICELQAVEERQALVAWTQAAQEWGS